MIVTLYILLGVTAYCIIAGCFKTLCDKFDIGMTERNLMVALWPFTMIYMIPNIMSKWLNEGTN